LEYLPSGVVGLTSLQKLDASDCEYFSWAEHTSSSTARAEFPNHEYATSRASIEDICKLSALTELSLEVGKIPLNICKLKALTDLALEVGKIPLNMSALKNLKILELRLYNLTSLPANMSHWWKQLQHLDIHNVLSLKYFPNSFTSRGAFPALITLKINCKSLVEFPDVEDGALSKLRKLEFSSCYFLKTLPLSLNRLTSLKKLILYIYTQTLYNSCIQNCEKAPIWRTPIFTCFYMIDEM
jgi:hypothetical protein